MKNILEKSLQTAHSYTEYKRMVLELLKEGKSTGINQNEDLFHFTKLNNQRMKRLDKQTKLNECKNARNSFLQSTSLLSRHGHSNC